MLFIDNIKRIVEIGIASAYVKNERHPLSIILLANPEAGKSSILLDFNFKRLKKVFVFTDMTKSIMEKFFKELKDPNSIKYIVIPDFLRITSHSRTTKSGIMATLNSGIEEGIREITVWHGSGQPETTPLKSPIRFGIATATTKQMIGDSRKQWDKIGFMSRLMPVSFSYTKEQARTIRKHLAFSKDLQETTSKMALKQATVKCKGKFVQMFDPHIDRLVESTYIYGFRYEVQFRTMLKANALLHGRTEVNKNDVRDIEFLSRWINMKYNPVE